MWGIRINREEIKEMMKEFDERKTIGPDVVSRYIRRKLESSITIPITGEHEVDVTKTMMRLRKIETEGDNTMTEMGGVKEKFNGCKALVKKILQFINVWESNSTQWRNEKTELRNEINNLKKVNIKRVKEIEKLKKENEDLKRTQGTAKQSKEKIKD